MKKHAWILLVCVVFGNDEVHAAQSLQYRVRRGDTLSRIAQRHLGKASAWKRIVAANSNILKSGQPLAVGTLLILPSRAVAHREAFFKAKRGRLQRDTLETSVSGPQRRSKEWRDLPRQKWEFVQIRIPGQFDPQGFDRSSKLHFKVRPKRDLPSWLSDQPIAPLGEIQASLVEGRYFHARDRIVIQPREGQVLAVGQEYTLTSEPTRIDGADGRRTYEYLNLGTVRLLSVEENRATAEVLGSTDLIARGAWVVARVPMVREDEPKSSQASVQGTLMISRTTGGSYATAQHKLVYIDRGSQDGVQIGNVFRAYGDRDPDTDERVEFNEFIRLGHAQVLMTTAQFSLGIVLNSRSALDDYTKVVLVNDASDLSLNPDRVLPPSAPAPEATDPQVGDVAPPPAEAPPPPPLSEDELDKLDDGKGLTEEERKNLEQLETTPALPPEVAPPPIDDPSGSPAEMAPSDMIPPTDAAPVPEAPTEVEPPPL